MVAQRNNFSQLLAPGLADVMFEWLESHPEEYSQFLRIEDSTRAYEDEQIVAGLGSVPRKPEGESLQYDDPIQGGTKRYLHETFALGFRVTKEMWDDEQYGTMKQVAQDFSSSIRQTIESNGANVLNGAFGAVTTANGKPLVDSAQPLLGGGTYSNRVTTNVALSVTGMQEAIILFEKMVNERGLIKRLVPQRLWISPDLQWVAGEILHSSYKPFTGNNEVNVMQGRLDPLISHYASSTTAWFVLSAQADHRCKFKWRQRPQMDRADDFDTKSAKFSNDFRHSTGATHWQGVVGSLGV